jgi:hypothetical protein
MSAGCAGSQRVGRTATATPITPATVDESDAIIDPGSPGAFGVGYIELSAPALGSRIAAWYPTDVTDGSPATPSPIATRPQAFPVVLLAPGDAGSGKSFTYLAGHLASWGYVVLSTTGPETNAPTAGQRFSQMWTRLTNSSDATAQLLAARLRATKIALIAASSAAAAPFEEAIGLDVGAIVILGANPPNIGAAASNHIPAMIMSSGRDERGGDPVAMRRLFENAGPAVQPYLVYFPDGVHDSFVDACLANCSPVFTQQRAHELVTRYVTAFLQTYVGGDARYVRDLGESSKEQAEDEDDAPDVIITRIGS